MMPRRKRADLSVKRVSLPYVKWEKRGDDTDILYQGKRIMTMYADGDILVTDAERSDAIIARRLGQIAEQQGTGLTFRADLEVRGIWVRTRKRVALLPTVIGADEMEPSE